MRSIKITPEGKIFEVNIDLENLFGGDTLFEIVRARHNLEVLNDIDGRVVMLVDEDGVRRRLPFNLKASALYRRSYRLDWNTFIYGDAFLFGEALTDEGIDIVPLQDRVTLQDITDLIDALKRK